MKVALFITCFNDTVFPSVGKATVGLLERLGVEVDFPRAQTCCGQMHHNTGYRKEALGLLRRHVEIFSPYDAIVTPSASCAATVREAYPRQAQAEPELLRAVEALGAKTYELSEYLLDVLQVSDVGAYYPHRVTYHPTCHGLRLLGLGQRPLSLLREVKGIDLVELPRAEECCGFGGTFALKNPDVSSAMLSDKMRHVVGTGAEICTAGDSSCLAHIGGGLSRSSAGVRTVHLAEVLAATEEAS